MNTAMKQWLRDSPMRRTALRVFQKVNPGDVTIRHTTGFLRLSACIPFVIKATGGTAKNASIPPSSASTGWIEPGSAVIEVGAHIGYFLGDLRFAGRERRKGVRLRAGRE